MGWRLPVGLFLVSALLGLIYFFYPRRRYRLPSIIFDKPEPRDDGPQRWWHIPVYIDKPASKLKAFFTLGELNEVHAEMIVSEWNRPAMPMRWESDQINGTLTVDLKYHPQKREIKFIPVAIRRETKDFCFRAIVLDVGEACLTEDNFIQHAVKPKEGKLENGKAYSLTVRLWSPKHPKLSESKRYTLFVPSASDSNKSFTLKPD